MKPYFISTCGKHELKIAYNPNSVVSLKIGDSDLN